MTRNQLYNPGIDRSPEQEREFRRALEGEGSCPRCKSATGLKVPRELGIYCEDCGWPDEDFEDL